MIEFLMSIIAGWEPNQVADVFLLLVFVGFIFSIYYSVKDTSGPISVYSPSVLTTLGILGTFLGITIGLVNFDYTSHESIDQSIPSLLGGLRMAFVTSIAGLASAILIRTAVGIKMKFQPDTPDDVTSKDVYEILKAQHESMNLVRAAIAGEGDATVVTQLQKVRTDLNDGIKSIEKAVSGDGENSVSTRLEAINQKMTNISEEMKAEFRDFSSKMSEMATKHIIEALSEVIKNFNENLTEQFGDNFKQLNQGVEKLVTWQEEYRQQMIDSKEALDKAVEAMQAGADSLENIRKETEAIPPIMKTLEEVLVMLGTELSDLQNHIEHFGRIRDKAEEALPAISKNIEEITEMVKTTVDEGNKLYKKFVEETTDQVDWITTYLKDTANDLSDQNKEIVETMKQAADNVKESVVTIQKQGKEVVEDLGKSFKDTAATVTERLKDVLDKQGQEIGNLSETLKHEMQKAARDREEALNKEINELVKAMDKALQQELQRSLQGLADHLGAISRKFIDDYGTLTERMKEIVDKAERI